MLFGSFAHAEPKRMFFHCQGFVGNLALQVSSDQYLDGAWNGLTIERKDVYADYANQYVVTKSGLEKRAYNPRNPKYQGFEKYRFDTSENQSAVQPIYDWKTGRKSDGRDFSLYEFILPPRSELEKIWIDAGTRLRGGNKFTMSVQLKFNNGDDFISGDLDCGLNWKPN
jgi:hypothetical protein